MVVELLAGVAIGGLLFGGVGGRARTVYVERSRDRQPEPTEPSTTPSGHRLPPPERLWVLEGSEWVECGLERAQRSYLNRERLIVYEREQYAVVWYGQRDFEVRWRPTLQWAVDALDWCQCAAVREDKPT